MALTYTPAGAGEPCPDFDLPTTEGTRFRRGDLPAGRPFLVMFICNHCPYVKAIEDRLVALAKDLAALNVATVAICSNDAADYPEDSFDSLRDRAREKNYPFPYLHDESQDVARRFGAVCTPDFFLYDGDARLAYRGRLDDAWKDAGKVKRRELFEAAKLLADGRPAPSEQIPSMGCSIKWL